jgi:alpha-maltose-1-phosphate synthase
MGRLAANQSFLKELIRHGGLETLHCCPHQPRQGEMFEELARDLGATMPVRTIRPHQQDLLAELGGLHVTEPSLIERSIGRSFVGPHAYALTGVTHATADATAMASLAGYVSAAVQPWDALVCTSRAVLAMVEGRCCGPRRRSSRNGWAPAVFRARCCR